MHEEDASTAIQRYLDEWPTIAGDSPAEPVVGSLRDRAVRRPHRLCDTLLHRS
jgi:hypothetical protein